MKNLLAGVLNIAIFSSAAAIYVYKMDEVRADQIVKGFGEKEIHCLQQNIYFEARNQSTLGQVSVAWVTLNRMENPKYPDTICDVVWQRKQFSWTHDGKPDRPGKNVVEQSAWKQAGYVARSVIMDWAMSYESPVGDATMYHADYVNPYWSSSYKRVAQIDNHIFYEK